MQLGANISTVRLDDLAVHVSAKYQFTPTLKISIGNEIYKNMIFHISYHHLLPEKKLSINTAEPYNFSGYTS